MRFRYLLPLLAAAGAAFPSAPPVAVDTRAELMGILFRLAGNPEYNQCRVPAYEKAIDAHFAPVRDHAAVQLARKLRQSSGVSYDAVVSLAIHLDSAAKPVLRTALDALNLALESRWLTDRTLTQQFLASLPSFVADSRFMAFVDAQQPVYTQTAATLRQVVESNADFTWFPSFYGGSTGAKLFVAPLLVTGTGSFGPKYISAEGQEELFAILGVEKVDAAGQAVYTPAFMRTLIHEFSHSYVNHLVTRVAARIAQPAAAIHRAVEEPMRMQAYRNGKTVVDESIVRASVARYVLAKLGPERALMEVREQQVRGFVWTPELYELLGEYEKDRARYPSLEAFIPRIAEYFEQLAPRVGAVVKQYEDARPEIVMLSPQNGSNAVPPATSELVFRFSKPMAPRQSVLLGPGGRKTYPQVVGSGFDDSGTLYTIRVQLEPDHDYELQLNREYMGGFVSRELYPAKPLTVRFRTAAP